MVKVYLRRVDFELFFVKFYLLFIKRDDLQVYPARPCGTGGVGGVPFCPQTKVCG